MKIHIEIDESTLKKLIQKHITGLTNLDINMDQITIQVKSKQNYRSEWEPAAFRAIYDYDSWEV